MTDRNTKHQSPNTKKIPKHQTSNMEGKRHVFDLEERTLEFGKRVIRLCRALPQDSVNDRLIRQVIGSSDSVGSNYREANDALSKKDTINRMRIARKEAKETKLHLELIAEANPNFRIRMNNLLTESEEIKRILSTIIKNLTE